MRYIYILAGSKNISITVIDSQKKKGILVLFDSDEFYIPHPLYPPLLTRLSAGEGE